ncbi:hypothetical protein COB21_05075 [Candidatus Aerophobetes bacterium]|uniref:beta-N-acetylhexosaminidase n=1 Tax=Aerophobetes bacterium TaxID=2030807 RepID=A0A2A4X1J5_UNCAE|nr:MAG: hypothetical protein COB21_05075 [Candidatus Aerophobetes bacterium]
MKNFFFTLVLMPTLLLAGALESESIMSLEEKVGQLFALPFAPKYHDEIEQDFVKALVDYNIGGVLVKQATVRRAADFIHYVQSQVKTPVLMSTDSEWGVGMRLSDGVYFPKALTLGSIEDEDCPVIETIGEKIGEHCKLIGLHWNFAPVMDVNSDSVNPVIHMRSFGDSFDKVTACTRSFYKGMEKTGVMACGKHFPGHGSVKTDSHLGLPILDKTLEQMEKEELVPFFSGCNEGISSIMVAHILVPEVDSLMPATLSKAWVQGVLKDKWGYEGIVVTDALNMGALKNLTLPTGEMVKDEDLPLLALQAGNDVLLYGTHHLYELKSILEMLPRAIDKIVKAAEMDRDLADQIDASVNKILEHKRKFIDLDKSLPTDKQLLPATYQGVFYTQRLYDIAIEKSIEAGLEEADEQQFYSQIIDETAKRVLEDKEKWSELVMPVFTDEKTVSEDFNKSIMDLALSTTEQLSSRYRAQDLVLLTVGKKAAYDALVVSGLIGTDGMFFSEKQFISDIKDYKSNVLLDSFEGTRVTTQDMTTRIAPIEIVREGIDTFIQEESLSSPRVFVWIESGGKSPGAPDFGPSQEQLRQIEEIVKAYPKAVLALVGSPYLLESVKHIHASKLVTYEDNPEALLALLWQLED